MILVGTERQTTQWYITTTNIYFVLDVEESDDIQIVYKSTCPRDYTLEKKPFLVREFYVGKLCLSNSKRKYVGQSMSTAQPNNLPN